MGREQAIDGRAESTSRSTQSQNQSQSPYASKTDGRGARDGALTFMNMPTRRALRVMNYGVTSAGGKARRTRGLTRWARAPM
jgi:hypothetical protein